MDVIKPIRHSLLARVKAAPRASDILRMPIRSTWRRRHKLSVLIVEYRDEVFARLAADLQAMQLTVSRACTAAEASSLVNSGTYDLVIANRDLPDESGWLMVSKWRLSQTGVPVWLYAPWESALAAHWAQFTRVLGVVCYNGDVTRLSEQIKTEVGQWLASH